ncbi:PREDICTED: uncharacterized protein LOC109222431 isoform X2 [Nicotiana attenuata]|uniref:uncharacterized protein LOC109222431 isoform X2 n=1 Tax=Nicotiana attenuata TaxID=49451 RepID=UPI000905399F|nr:PREDICTED: uncharacterized protein LOC109222431 isoform X2 [Nicotiana attenuata]
MTTQQKSNIADHLEPWRQLQGKVVFVTGASAGLGREFCLDLARAGCKVVAAARRADRLKSLCDEINIMASSNTHLVRAVAIELDITADGPTIEASVKKAWDAFGYVDALINNAGVRGSWLVSKYVGRYMKAAKRGGSIINISSAAGLNRVLFRGGIAYISSKAAMDSITKVMT